MPDRDSAGADSRASWDASDLEIVPDWLRSAPGEGPIKGGDRDIAAQSLDRELGPVAGLESRCRLIR
ncbi:MAG: hypothetical protein HY899_04960, partial [Deltaproteobacteria bacterium]|nr:hypothetical protein [Deltaproteobacteria bacterium]